jgi:DNA-binding transcriptional LysR family regulator
MTRQHEISWDDFRLVKHIAHSRGLMGAARALLIDHSTVFRRLGQIEGKLGQRLFVRHRTGYTPTAAGEEVVAMATRMDEEIEEWTRRLAKGPVHPAGELRVHTDAGLLAHLLVPVFADFRKQNPRIRLEVVLENDTVNIPRRETDVSIIATSVPPEDVCGRRLATVGWAVYGSARNFSSAENVTMADLLESPWVAPAGDLAGLRAARFIDRHVPQELIAYRVGTIIGLADAIAAGLGVGYLPCYLGERIAGLTRLTEPQEDFNQGLWVLTHPHLYHTPRVGRLLEFLFDSLARQQGLLAGVERNDHEAPLVGEMRLEHSGGLADIRATGLLPTG